jgi:hypothetical protein
LSIFKEYYRKDGKYEVGMPGEKAILKIVGRYFDLLFCTFSKTGSAGQKTAERHSALPGFCNLVQI